MTSLAQSEDEKSAKVWWWFNSLWSWVLWLGLFLCIPLATVGWYVEDTGGAGDFDPNHMFVFHLLGTISSAVLVLMASASVLFFRRWRCSAEPAGALPWWPWFQP